MQRKETLPLPPRLSFPTAGGGTRDRPVGTSASDRLSTRSVPLIGMSAAIVGLLGLPVAAHAAFTPPTNGPYRLLFVTSTKTPATDPNISTYNSFVTTAAGLNRSLPDTSWAAIVSTAATSALTNVDSICSTADCQAAPIYLVDGTLIASNQGDFFGNLLANAPDQTETGATYSNVGDYVWTGSTAKGEINVGHAMGSSPAELGTPSTKVNNYLDAGYAAVTSKSVAPYADSYPLYAISGELGVPEPASDALLLVGAVATGLVRRRRKRPSPAA